MHRYFLPLLLLCSFSAYSQFVVKGELYDPLSALSTNNKITLYRSATTGFEVVAVSTDNPFSFFVEDTTNLYISISHQMNEDLSFLYDARMIRHSFLGIQKNPLLGIVLFGDQDSNSDLNTLDNLRIIRKYLSEPCPEFGVDNKTQVFKINQNDLDLSLEDAELRAKSLSALKDTIFKISNFTLDTSWNLFYVGTKGIVTEESSNYISYTVAPELEIKVSDKILKKNEKNNIAMKLKSVHYITDAAFKIGFEFLDSIVLVKQELLPTIFNNEIIFYISSDSRSPYYTFDKNLEFEVWTNKDISTREVFRFTECGLFQNEMLYVEENKIKSTSNFEIKYDSTLVTKKCELIWPRDTLLPTCTALSNYEPEIEDCEGIYYSINFTDQIYFDSLGRCLYAERQWEAKSFEYKSIKHVQLIKFLPINSDFCKSELTWDLSVQGDSIGVGELLTKGEIEDFAFDANGENKAIKPGGNFDLSLSIPLFDLVNKEVCFSKIRIFTCPKLSKLAIRPIVYKNRNASGFFTVYASDFDEGTYNNCDKVASITIAKSLTSNFAPSITRGLGDGDIIDFYIKILLESGRYEIVPVQVAIATKMVDDFYFDVEDEDLTEGKVHRVIFSSPNFINVGGLQCQLHIENADFKGDTLLSFLKEEYGRNFLFEYNDYRFIWISKSSQNKDFSDQPLFAIDILPKRNCKVSDIFTLSNGEFESFLIDNGLGKRPINLKFNFKKGNVTPLKNVGSKIIRLANPSDGRSISFLDDLPGTNDLIIYNSVGQILERLELSDVYKGEPVFINNMLQSGQYFIRLHLQDNGFFTSKLMVIE